MSKFKIFVSISGFFQVTIFLAVLLALNYFAIFVFSSHFCSYSRIKIFSYTNFTTFAGIAGAVEEVSLAAVAGDGVDDPGRGDRVHEGRLSATYFTKHENW